MDSSYINAEMAVVLNLWDLPETVVFHVVCFAAPRTQRTRSVCQLALLCKSSYSSILADEKRSMILWEIVLKEEYSSDSDRRANTRSCKRLRRNPLQKVKDAHQLVKNNTELCYFYLSELTNSTTRKGALSRQKLVRLMDEYGPHLQFNSVVSSGGLFLVELCRARSVQESTILNCVRLLVVEGGAMLNLSTCEPPTSLTALAVASARGMSTVVKFLLSKGADTSIRSSGRFRLHTSKKTIRCIDVTPLDFAQAMLKAEKREGASERSVAGLVACVKLLLDAVCSRS